MVIQANQQVNIAAAACVSICQRSEQDHLTRVKKGPDPFGDRRDERRGHFPGTLVDAVERKGSRRMMFHM
jgi:hypothetical protein